MYYCKNLKLVIAVGGVYRTKKYSCEKLNYKRILFSTSSHSFISELISFLAMPAKILFASHEFFEALQPHKDEKKIIFLLLVFLT